MPNGDQPPVAKPRSKKTTQWVLLDYCRSSVASSPDSPSKMRFNFREPATSEGSRYYALPGSTRVHASVHKSGTGIPESKKSTVLEQEITSISVSESTILTLFYQKHLHPWILDGWISMDYPCISDSRCTCIDDARISMDINEFNLSETIQKMSCSRR